MQNLVTPVNGLSGADVGRLNLDTHPDIPLSTRRAIAAGFHPDEHRPPILSVGVDPLALEAYSSWLYFERKRLCRQMYAYMPPGGGENIHPANAGWAWHVQNDCPPPSTRTLDALRDLGIDWTGGRL